MEFSGSSVLFGSADLARSAAVRSELRRRGVTVSAAGSGRALLDLAERHPPDIVVLDAALDPSGIEPVAALLRYRYGESLLILVLEEDRNRDSDDYSSLDPWTCLVHPVNDADLLAVLTRALQNRCDARRKPAAPVITCVDDDPVFLKSVARILRKRGYRVVPCANAEQALESIPLARPAAVFMDILMPGMNGLDLTSELRERLGETMPLILLSGRSSDQEIREGIRSGATCYLTKPCEARELVSVADRYAGGVGSRDGRSADGRTHGR